MIVPTLFPLIKFHSSPHTLPRTQLKNSFTFALLRLHLPFETEPSSRISCFSDYISDELFTNSASGNSCCSQRLESRKAYRFLQIRFAASQLRLKPLNCSDWKIHRSHMNELRFVTIRVHRRAFSCFSALPTIVSMMNVYGATLFSHLSFPPPSTTHKTVSQSRSFYVRIVWLISNKRDFSAYKWLLISRSFSRWNIHRFARVIPHFLTQFE